MNMAIIVNDPSGVFSSHFSFWSFPPLFSPTNVIFQIEMMKILLCLWESLPPPKKGLPIAQFKVGVKKRNYDATTKFQDSWVAKFLWVKLCVGSNGNLHTVKCRICNEVEGTNKLLLLKWDCLYKHVGCKKVERILGLMWRKGIGIIQRFPNMPRIKNYLLFIVVNLLMPKLQIVLLEKNFKKLCNLLLRCIWCNKDVPCWNMKHWRLCFNSCKCQKIIRNIGVIMEVLMISGGFVGRPNFLEVHMLQGWWCQCILGH